MSGYTVVVSYIPAEVRCIKWLDLTSLDRQDGDPPRRGEKEWQREISARRTAAIEVDQHENRPTEETDKCKDA